MSEAKTIVTEDATAAELPERFRGNLPPAQKVVVTVMPVAAGGTDQEPEPARKGEAKYLRYWGIAADRNTSIEDAVARVRELRDEWDDR